MSTLTFRAVPARTLPSVIHVSMEERRDRISSATSSSSESAWMVSSAVNVVPRRLATFRAVANAAMPSLLLDQALVLQVRDERLLGVEDLGDTLVGGEVLPRRTPRAGAFAVGLLDLGGL